MKIEQIFSKKLTRNINGVVKAEQVDNESVFIELDEYVVTKELDRHFREFFEVYVPAVTNPSSNHSGKMGVWVSGFFGSGKSHFIKILSYLLENRQVENNGKTFHAIDFFKQKINDPMLLADIQSVVNNNTDAILFNIDSRANTDEKEDAILKVFLKVFNQRAGYCPEFPHIAHLERELDKRGQYEKFKEKYQELTESSWEVERDSYDFYLDELKQALAFAGGQSEESAQQRVEQLEKNFPLNINNFCKWVKDYLDTSGDKTLLFLVDEVGQFIGKNTQMMLKLQTITEDLGVICGGRAWVVVTSQADIDATIGNMDTQEGNDFSKIQGRFYTRLQLSSSNTSEVIQKRLLEKTPKAHDELIQIFSEKGDILRNQLSFDTATVTSLKGYGDAPSFVDNYPFIPYHYTLVQNVFEAIRTTGATGKHLAMGERSLLDAFQSAAKQFKDCELDVLIPFYSFYAPIESFLEPAVKRTIDQACEQDSLSEFDGTILKTLFLIRYVDAVKSTLDNLVTLSIDKIDTDKIALKKKIDESLVRLERELLIMRNGDEFIFLTNEEKEIENEIRKTDIESSEITNKLSSIVFDEVLQRKNTYTYPLNKQLFRISRFCNSHPKDGSTLEDLVVKVISPLDAHFDNFASEQHCFDYTAEGDGCVLVKLADNKRLWSELTTYIKTDRYLNQSFGQRPEQERLLRDKQMENVDREKRLRGDFTVLFIEADVYAIGTKLSSGSDVPVAILEQAYKYVIENTFGKLSLLNPTPGDARRQISAVLGADDIAQLGLDLKASECNPQATMEVEQYISLKVDRNEVVNLADVIKRFSRRPFGWPDDEILLLVARLGLAGKISFTQKGVPLALKQAHEPFDSVRKRVDVRIQKIRQHDDNQLKNAARLLKNLFTKTFTGSGEKELYELIHSELTTWNEGLKSFKSKSQTGKYPGKADIEKGLVLIAGILNEDTSYALIQRFVEDTNKLENFAEDYEDLEDFYNNQFRTWQTLGKALNEQFKANRPALGKNKEAHESLEELERIFALPNPYGQLHLIKPLIEKVQNVNNQLVRERRTHALGMVNARIDRVITALKDAGAPDDLSHSVLRPLQLSKQQITDTESIPQIHSEQSEAKAHEESAYSANNEHIESLRQKAEAENRRRDAEEERKRIEAKEKGKPLPPPPPPLPPPPAPKRTVTIDPADIISAGSGDNYLETEQEVTHYLDKLREQLLKAIKAGDRVWFK